MALSLHHMQAQALELNMAIQATSAPCREQLSRPTYPDPGRQQSAASLHARAADRHLTSRSVPLHTATALTHDAHAPPTLPGPVAAAPSPPPSRSLPTSASAVLSPTPSSASWPTLSGTLGKTGHTHVQRGKSETNQVGKKSITRLVIAAVGDIRACCPAAVQRQSLDVLTVLCWAAASAEAAAGPAWWAPRTTATGFFLSWLQSARAPSEEPVTHSVPVT